MDNLKMIRKLLGTDGILGTANIDRMTGEMALQFVETKLHRFAKDLAKLVKKHFGK